MSEPGLIAEYLDALGRELRFDAPLCRRVCAEVEDHLHESVAADTDTERRAAECRAIERFGAPRDLAAQFAALALTRQTKATGVLVMLVVVGVYIAMRGRLMWWGPAASLQSWAFAATAITIMRATFWFAVVVGLVGWAYSTRVKVSSLAGTAGRRWLRRCLVLSGAATAAVVALVTLEATFVSLRLMAAAWSAAIVVPLLFIGAEAVLASILVVQWIDVMHRRSITAGLLRH